MRKSRQFVEQLNHPTREREVAEPHQVAFRRVRAEKVDRGMIEVARVGGFRANEKRELLEFLGGDRLIIVGR